MTVTLYGFVYKSVIPVDGQNSEETFVLYEKCTTYSMTVTYCIYKEERRSQTEGYKKIFS